MNETKLNDVATKCTNRHLIVRADVSKEEEAKSVVDNAVNDFGKIDILVNNAGLVRYGSVLLGNFLKAHDEVMATNMRGVAHLTSLCVEQLIENKGNIVNVCSIGGLMSTKEPMLLSYCVSKAALNLFTQGVALELAEYGVRVNSVCPGPVVTELIENSGVPKSAVSWTKFEAHTPLKRVGEPEEIAELIMFLASDMARSVTGSNYVSDNGTLLKR